MKTRRQVLAQMCAGGLAAVLGADAHPMSSSKRKPNVIILLIDDLGYGDLGSFGCTDIPTPNMDRLAARGVKCTFSYITNPPCSPSRTSLMTGMYAQRFGKFGMARGLPIPDDKPTLGEFMRDAGYVTGMVGKWDIGFREQSPMRRGFLEVARHNPLKEGHHFVTINEDGSEGWRTDTDGDMMADFVERNKDRPFFLYFSPLAIHSPSGETPERFRHRTTAEGRRRALAGALVSVDDQVGKLLTVLEKHDLMDNTLIMLTGDNGPNLNEQGSSSPYRGGKGKGTQQEGWVHTPTIISWPGVLPEGAQYDGLMCTLDFYATAAAAAGKKAPGHCDGVNLLPYLSGDRKGDVHERLFWLNCDPTDPKHRHLTVVRWKNWRLLKNKKLGWQLFDLETDPREEKDLAKKYPEIVENMAKSHAEWAATLPPVKTAKPNGLPGITGGEIPVGYGWEITKR